MILTPKAKPVRIRITSNGKDNSTIEELKRNFCIADVIPLIEDKRLCRWLLQIGEKNVAKTVDNLLLSDDAIKRAMQVLMVFFEDIKNAHSIADLIDPNKKLATRLSDDLKEEINHLICFCNDKNLIEDVILRTYKYNQYISDYCQNYSRLATGDEVFDLYLKVDDNYQYVKGQLLNLAARGGSEVAKKVACKCTFLGKAIADIKNSLFGYELYIDRCQTDYEKQVLYLLYRISNKYYPMNNVLLMSGRILTGKLPFSFNVDFKESEDIEVIWNFITIIDRERSFCRMTKDEWKGYESILNKYNSELIESYRGKTWIWKITIQGINKLVAISKEHPEFSVLQDTLKGKYNSLSNENLCTEEIFNYMMSFMHAIPEK